MMKFLKYLAVIFLLLTSQAHAFNFNGLTDDNFIDRVIISLRQEPEKWIVRGHRILYFESDRLRDEASEASFPDVYNGCLIEISHDVIGYDNGYIIVEKPYDMNLRGGEFEQMAKAIREFIYTNLHNKFNIRMMDKKTIEHEEPVKEEIVRKEVKEKTEEYSPFGHNEERY